MGLNSIFLLLISISLVATVMLIYKKILPTIAAFGVAVLFCFTRILIIIQDIRMGAFPISYFLVQCVFFAGAALLIYAAFNNSIPDIMILGAAALFCVPAILDFIIYFDFSISFLFLLFSIGILGLLVLYVVISITSFLPDIASMIKPFWFAPGCIYFLYGILNHYFIDGAQRMNWAYLIVETVNYFILAYIASHREEA